MTTDITNPRIELLAVIADEAPLFESELVDDDDDFAVPDD